MNFFFNMKDSANNKKCSQLLSFKDKAKNN